MNSSQLINYYIFLTTILVYMINIVKISYKYLALSFKYGNLWFIGNLRQFFGYHNRLLLNHNHRFVLMIR